MTRYEELSIKIQNCLDAAHRTKGAISFMWFANANILIVRLESMSVMEAMRIVK
jgi:hypothetical protein